MGLLDFVRTPEGQGLLGAVAGGLAGARRGTPFNNVGRGLLGGTAAFGNALDREQQAQQFAAQEQDRQQGRTLREMQIAQAKTQLEREQAQQAWRQGLPGVVKQATEATYGAGDEGPTMTPADPSALTRYAMDPRSPYADKILESQLFPKAADFKTVGNSLVRIGPDGKVSEAYSAPEKQEKTAVEKLLDAAGITDPAMRQRFTLQALTKQTTHAPPVQVNAGQTLPPKFTEELDKMAAKNLMDQYGDARNAATAISAATDVISLLDQGAFTGRLGPAKESLSAWYQAATGQQIPQLDASQQLKTVIGDIVLPALSSLKGASSDRDFIKIEEYSRGESTMTETALRGHMQRLMNKYGKQLEGFNAQFDAYAQQRPDVSIPGISRIERPAGNLKTAPKASKKIKRTGTLNGRKVVEYEDGSVSYAD